MAGTINIADTAIHMETGICYEYVIRCQVEFYLLSWGISSGSVQLTVQLPTFQFQGIIMDQLLP